MVCDTKAAEPQVGRFHAVEKHIRWRRGQLPDEHYAPIEKSILRRYYARARNRPRRPRSTEVPRGAAMKNMRRVRIATISIVLVLCVPLWAERQEKTPEKPAAAFRGARSETGRGGDGPAEILSGRMGVHRDIRKVGVLPSGGKNTGVYTSKLGPGGNSLITTF